MRTESSIRESDGSVTITVDSDRRTKPPHKIWEEDPQLQIINLLKDIKVLLEKTEAKTAPYHTGPLAVKLPAPVPDTEQ